MGLAHMTGNYTEQQTLVCLLVLFIALLFGFGVLHVLLVCCRVLFATLYNTSGIDIDGDYMRRELFISCMIPTMINSIVGKTVVD